MQRLGVVESAAERVRELLTKANPIDSDRFPQCRAYRHDDVTIVVDEHDDVAKTVVKEVER
jgi:hypothetical protein